MPTLQAGAVLIQRVDKGRAGAEAEITFTNGARYLTWKKSLVAVARRFAEEATPVYPEIRRSATGNEYLAALSDSLLCDSHRWVWVRPMILRCLRCGKLKGAER